jgi:hypothetical protein
VLEIVFILARVAGFLLVSAEPNIYLLCYVFGYEDCQGLVEFKTCLVEFETDMLQLSLIQVTVWHTSLVQLLVLLLIELVALAA